MQAEHWQQSSIYINKDVVTSFPPAEKQMPAASERAAFVCATAASNTSGDTRKNGSSPSEHIFRSHHFKMPQGEGSDLETISGQCPGLPSAACREVLGAAESLGLCCLQLPCLRVVFLVAS